jgi:hypothetical protein
MRKLRVGDMVHDRWYPWRLGRVTKTSPSGSIWIRFDCMAYVERYDKPHATKFLVKDTK